MDNVTLCNIALGQIAAAANIQGINPPNPPSSIAAQTASMVFGIQRDAVFRAAHWNCARFQAAGTLVAAAWGTPENPNGTLPIPPIPWRYAYAYPDDCLLVRFVFPLNLPPNTSPALMTNVGVNYYPVINTSLPFVPAKWINPQGNSVKVILTNACKAQIVYTARVENPDDWDVHLQNAVIATLSAWFVNPLARNKELLAERVQIAQSLIMQARISDGNEGVTSADIMPDWIEVRFTGGWGAFGANVQGGGWQASWDSIGMPNGVSF